MQWMDSVLRRPGLSEELIDVVGDGDDKGKNYIKEGINFRLIIVHLSLNQNYHRTTV